MHLTTSEIFFAKHRRPLGPHFFIPLHPLNTTKCRYLSCVSKLGGEVTRSVWNQNRVGWWYNDENGPRCHKYGHLNFFWKKNFFWVPPGVPHNIKTGFFDVFFSFQITKYPKNGRKVGGIELYGCNRVWRTRKKMFFKILKFWHPCVVVIIGKSHP